MASEVKIIGAIGVRVRPVTDRFGEEARRGIRKEMRNVDAEAPVSARVDRGQVRRELSELKRMAEGTEASARIRVDLEKRAAERQLKEFRRELEFARKVVDLKIDADVSGLKKARKEIRFIKDQLAKRDFFANIKVNPHYDLDGFTQAEDAVRDRIRRIEALAKKRVDFTIDVKASDAEKLWEQLRKIEAQAESASRMLRKVNPELDERYLKYLKDVGNLTEDQRAKLEALTQGEDNLRVARLKAAQDGKRAEEELSAEYKKQMDLRQKTYDDLFRKKYKFSDLFKGMSEEDYARAREDAGKLAHEIERELRGIKAKVQVEPTGLALAAQRIRYAARDRDVTLWVRVSARSLVALEGMMKSLAGLNMLNQAGRWLENLATNFDKFALKVGTMSTVVGSLVNAFTALGGSIFTIGYDLTQLVGLAAMAPAMFAAIAAGVIINVAAFKDFKKAIDGDVEALAALPPVARETALALQGAWKAIQQPVQRAFWDGMGTALKEAAEVLIPRFSAGLEQAAVHVGRFGRGMMLAFKQAGNSGDIERMLKNLSGFFDNATGAAGPLVDAINRLGLRGSEYLPRFGQWLTDITVQFDNWLRKADEAGRINQWIETGVQRLKELGGVMRDTVRLLDGISKATALGNFTGLTGFANLLNRAADAINRPEFQYKLGWIFREANMGASALTGGLRDVARAVGDNYQWFGRLLLLLGQIGGTALTRVSDGIRNMQFQEGVTRGFEGLLRLLQQLQPASQAIFSILGQVLGLAGTVLQSLAPVVNTIAKIADAIVTKLAGPLEKLAPQIAGAMNILVTLASGPLMAIADILGGIIQVASQVPAPILAIVAAMVALKGVMNRDLSNSTMFAGLRREWTAQQLAAGKTAETMGRFSAGAYWRDTLSTKLRDVYTGVAKLPPSIQAVNGQMMTLSRTVALGDGPLRNLSQRFSSMPGEFSRIGGAATSLGSSFGTATGRLQGFGNVVRGLGAGAFRGLQSAVSGLMGVLGGPWGIALMAATAGLMAFMQNQQEAQARVQALSQELDIQTGKLTENGEKLLSQNAYERYGEQLDKVGIKASRFADIVSGAVQPQNDMERAILKSAEAVSQGSDGFSDWNYNANESTTEANRLGRQMNLTGSELDKFTSNMGAVLRGSRETSSELRNAGKQLESTAQQADNSSQRMKDLKAALDTVRDASSSTTAAVQAYKTALDLLNGGSLTAEEAAMKSADAFDQAKQTLVDLRTAAENGGQAIGFANGKLDSSVPASRRAYEAMNSVANGVLEQATAVYQAAIRDGESAEVAAQRARGVVDDNQYKLEELAKAAGVTVDQLRTNWDQFFGKNWQMTAIFAGNAESFFAVQEAVQRRGEVFDDTVFDALLTADPSLATASVETLQAKYDAWQNTPWSAKIAAEPSDALAAMAEVVGAGEAYRNGDYTAVLKAMDNATPEVDRVLNTKMAQYQGTAAVKSLEAKDNTAEGFVTAEEMANRFLIPAQKRLEAQNNTQPGIDAANQNVNSQIEAVDAKKPIVAQDDTRAGILQAQASLQLFIDMWMVNVQIPIKSKDDTREGIAIAQATLQEFAARQWIASLRARNEVQGAVNEAVGALMRFAGGQYMARLTAQDATRSIIDGAYGALRRWAGDTYRAYLTAEDRASAQATFATASLRSFAGGNYTATLRANDEATWRALMATSAMRAFSGGNYTATLRANDEATGAAIRAASALRDMARTYEARAWLNMDYGSLQRARSAIGDWVNGVWGTARVYMDYGSLSSARATIYNWLNGISVNAYVNVIRNNADGGVYMADGGILGGDELSGGSPLRRAGMNRFLKSRGENHYAFIAQPGTYRTFGEYETGGEAYIPLAMSKRSRSMDILSEVASRFGQQLVPAGSSEMIVNRSGHTVNVTNYFPQAEPTSQTVNSGLQMAASLGDD